MRQYDFKPDPNKVKVEARSRSILDFLNIGFKLLEVFLVYLYIRKCSFLSGGGKWHRVLLIGS